MHTLSLIVAALTFAPAGKESKAVAKERTLFEGTWIVESATVNGQPLPENLAKSLSMTFQGATCKSSYLTQVDSGVYRLYPMTKPRGIDLVFRKGQAAGKTRVGIYRFEKNRLVLCLQLRSDKRPTKFASTKDSWQSLLTLKRKKQVKAGDS